MPKTERDREISRRRQRRKKMEFLRGRLAETKDSKARAVLIQKILKINPQAATSRKNNFLMEAKKTAFGGGNVSQGF